ncbi:Maf family protein [Aneurinibacillus sp. Ricciae_BoGa-3]|uniref:Maf family protein n=1 Tax=Aneurinibacillus sp. Ricciae_BoGa-3 TaxID=3022697 RepID=UPI002341E704|nr:Maf family protein [Aneurinibacillus sp. Ricciae_BoGa-3]WCK53644.1 Maf family protein [Aneurinibacillus sp. Ricciae_BoGa-3]
MAENKIPIILASSSPRRKELLQGLGVAFSVMPSHADERVEGDVSPGLFVETLAQRKAQQVAHSCSVRSLVIGSDTVVVLNGEIMGKPADEDDAFRMLSMLAGNMHEVYTGLCVIDTAGKQKNGHTATRVFFRELSEERIRRYIATGEPMDKAGAYGIQGFGSAFVSRIEGDYFSIVGLPLILVSDFLEEFGVQLF